MVIAVTVRVSADSVIVVSVRSFIVIGAFVGSTIVVVEPIKYIYVLMNLWSLYRFLDIRQAFSKKRCMTEFRHEISPINRCHPY